MYYDVDDLIKQLAGKFEELADGGWWLNIAAELGAFFQAKHDVLCEEARSRIIPRNSALA